MIKMEAVSLVFGEKKILEQCSEEILERGIICLFGPSGCGKTTFARVLTGLQKPDSGCVTGIRLGETAIMFQEHRLLPWLTVRDNVAAVLQKGGDAMLWLRAVGLNQVANLLPDALSGGMKRRVAFARALAYDSKFLVLDEPFQGLDIIAKQALYPYVRAAAETKPVLLITHDEEEAKLLSDVIWYVDGPPLHVLERQNILDTEAKGN